MPPPKTVHADDALSCLLPLLAFGLFAFPGFNQKYTVEVKES
jgi:hypothetical protein